MKPKRLMFKLELEVLAGTHVLDAAKDAVRISKLLGVMVEFDHNGVRLLACPWTKPGDMEREFEQRMAKRCT